MTKKKLSKKLDVIFSKYIRWYYADANGYVECYTCGITKPVKEMQCGHFQSRRHYATRWHTDNCKPQCVKCNMFMQGNIWVYGNKLKAEIGDVKFNKLIQLSNSTVKYTQQDYLDMLEYYKKELNNLM